MFETVLDLFDRDRRRPAGRRSTSGLGRLLDRLTDQHRHDDRSRRYDDDHDDRDDEWDRRTGRRRHRREIDDDDD